MQLFCLKFFSALTLFLSLTGCSSSTTETKLPSAKTSSISPTALEILNRHQPATEKTTDLVDRFASQIFAETNPQGMAIVVIDNDQIVTRYYGETAPGARQKPGPNSLIRIASLTKLMTSEVMIKLEADKKLRITDPLQNYSYFGTHIPIYHGKQPIRLYHLASHTSGLPREQPGGKIGRPVFVWPTQSNRWTWLKKAKIKCLPGTKAAYSNLAYDLLADALAKAAGKSYKQLFAEKITLPAEMYDTTFTPTTNQCSRLMVGYKSSPCISTLAAAGSGGVYSTPADMQRWMQQFLSTHTQVSKQTAQREQAIYFARDMLTDIKGMDVAGHADGIGLGWVYMNPRDGIPGIYQKTGGGGGFNTYMTMIPQQRIGIFAVISRKKGSKFSRLTEGVNDLTAALTINHNNNPFQPTKQDFAANLVKKLLERPDHG